VETGLQTGEETAVKDEKGGKVHLLRDNWCRDFEARYHSCHQPVPKTSTGPHPFFNHQQTPEGRDVAPFYVCYQKSVPGILSTTTIILQPLNPVQQSDALTNAIISIQLAV